MSTSSTTTTPRTRTGCQNCRLRHLKCDEQRPSCTRCEKAEIDCVRGYNIRFKHGANPSVANGKNSGQAKTEYDFSATQPWVNTARSLTFLDETQELVSIYDHAAEPDEISAASITWNDGTQSTSKGNDGTRSSPGSGLGSFSQLSDSPAAGSVSMFGERISSTGQTSISDIGSPTKRRRLTFGSPYDGSVASATSAPLFQSPAQSWPLSPQSGTQSGLGGSVMASGDFESFAVLEHPISHGNPSFINVSESLSRIYLDTPVWPLSSIEEARLLRYYVENLARNFDLTDPLAHFRKIVPQRAATCPTLLNAIFALSARHLSRVGAYDPLISNKYHQECLKHLIPMLDDHAAILDENLLASTIILRHLEEIEVPLSGQLPNDQQSHLLGAHAFMNAQERASLAGGLRRAAFWVGLRQEIYVAFVNQRSIIPTLEHCNIDRSLEAAEDHIWACRMVVLCADVLRYCFGGDGEHATTATFIYLADAVDKWHASKPASFTPVYHRPADALSPTTPDDTMGANASKSHGNVFPELWFVGDEVVIGLQHYHISRILLAAHNPRIPRLGPGRARALRTMDEEIKAHVRTLCGICVSNAETPPNFTYASMGVTMAGDKFTDRREQEALLEVLGVCEARHAWPTGTAMRNLRVAWGWEDEGSGGG